MHPALQRTDHRPWPIPDGRWTWRQSWCDLLFAHWPVAVDALRPLVPDELEIQQRDGTSWVGVVPFRMEGVTRRPLPDIPGISAFPELNLRLYVERDGRPGVWFLSLDATNRLAVWTARRLFHLPYFHARIEARPDGDDIRYDSRRSGSGVEFRARYGPRSAPYEADPGTLEHWLTERYCLYARSPARRLFRTEVHHVPWPLQRAEAIIETSELGRPFGLELAGPPALLHFARRIDVVVWPPQRVG
jgi:uncharacterized protein YqjF (DUF2071 family)